MSGTHAAWGPLRDFCIFEERIRQNVENVATLRAVLWRRLSWRTALLVMLVACMVQTRRLSRLLGLLGLAPTARLETLLFVVLLSLCLLAVGLVAHSAAAWRRAVAGSQYEGQCHKALAPFAMQLRLLPAGLSSRPAGLAARLGALARRLLLMPPRTVASGEITFARRLPRPLALFLEAYRAEYRARRALRLQPGLKKTA